MPEAPFPWAYRAGELVRHRDLTIHAESLAMRYGLSAFEGVRGYVQRGGGVRLFALDEHLDRLAATLRLGGCPTFSRRRIEAAVAELMAANRPRMDCYLRIAVNMASLGTLRSDARGALFLSLRPMGRKPVPRRGLHVALSSRRKPHDAVFPQRAKMIVNYAGPRLASLEARTAGFDDVVLRGPHGQLAEAPTANLFLVRDGRVLTPRLEDGILAGITRRHVIDLCRRFGREVIERRLSADDAYGADEAFLCGTAVELLPIGRFDHQRLVGPRRLFSPLLAAYFARVRGATAAGGHP